MEGLHPCTKISGITGLEGIIDPASCVIQGGIEAVRWAIPLISESQPKPAPLGIFESPSHNLIILSVKSLQLRPS